MEVKVVKFYIKYNTKITQKLADVNNDSGYDVFKVSKLRS